MTKQATKEFNEKIAMEMAIFEFLSNCEKNGATYEQAKAEMNASIDIIAEQVKAILKTI